MPRLHLPSYLKLLIKIFVSGLCLWFVFNKIDWANAAETFSRTNIGWLLLAVVLFIISKIISAVRLNIYFRNMDVHLPEVNNLKLYWLGMFYNLFLPGGIGGDAYKVILLKKRTNKPTRLLSAAVLLDRISGVAGLMILSGLFYFFIFRGENYSTFILVMILPGVALFYLIVRKYFPTFIKGFWATFWMGLGVQLVQVICALIIMLSLGIKENQIEYLLIFLVSSIVAILPFTIGGLGAREVVFLYGSHIFLLDKSESICISLLFYLITVVVSMPGLFWEYRNPLNSKT